MKWHLAMLDVVFPEDCPGCEHPADGGALCEMCHASLPRFLRPVTAPDGIRTAWVLGTYTSPLGALVRRGKYRPDSGVFQWLGNRLGDAAANRLPHVDMVSWVPTPWRRRFVRGFDQAELMARPVASALNVPAVSTLRRMKASPQTQRARHARAQGIRGAFAVKNSWSTQPPPHSVLLVDDVVTTGATAQACAEELLCSGVERVHLLCVVDAVSTRL